MPRQSKRPSRTNTAIPSPNRRRILTYLGLGMGGGILWNITGGLRGFPKLSTFKFEMVTVDVNGKEQDRRKGSGKHFVEELSEEINLDMIRIPGGSFLMGSPEDEEGRDSNEGPQYRVQIPEFFMGRYPVTQAQWRFVAGLDQIDRILEADPSKLKGDSRPVENVNWKEADEFCARLSLLTGKQYRLPSEAQWEYACRARTTTPFYFGSTLTFQVANYNANYTYGSGPRGGYRRESLDVGQFPANSFGLHDMHDNVREWCQDYWHNNYKGAPRDGRARERYKQGANIQRIANAGTWTDTRSHRVLRGGSWGAPPKDCRSANRYRVAPDERHFSHGFRLVMSVPGFF